MSLQVQAAESGRVLLVEHDAAEARALVDALSEVAPFDFEIDFAAGLDEAEELLRAGRFDLVLLDIEMPGVPAEAAVERLAGRLDGAALIALVPLGMEDLALGLLSAGASDWLVHRTLRRTELGRSIRYALERQQLVREASAREGRLQAALDAQKTWMVGRLAAGLAHEFSNLLTGLLGDAEDLLGSTHDGDPHRLAIQDLARGMERAAMLTRQLVSFTRRGAESNRQPLDINMVVSSMVPMAESLLGSRIRLVVDCCRQPARVSTGPSQIEQVLLNLLSNARDAMPDGGTVRIETALVRRKAGPYVLLTVRDSGVGMERHTVSRIFEPYFTTKAERGRVGLGLAAVSSIVEHARGHTEVESAPGQGTEFRILLPALEEVAEDEAGESGPHAPLAGRPPRVIVVEDCEPVRRLLSRALEQAGYEAEAVGDGAEALALAASSDVAIDLLLTDVVMPHLNGRDLADELRRRFPKMRTLFISGYDEDVLAPEGVLVEGVNFLPKPFHLREALRLVRKLLDR